MIELAITNASNECLPLDRGEHQHCSVWMLRIADGGIPIDDCNFNAAVGTAPRALAPLRSCQVHLVSFLAGSLGRVGRDPAEESATLRHCERLAG